MFTVLRARFTTNRIDIKIQKNVFLEVHPRSRDKTSLLSTVFHEQNNSKRKGEWINTVNKNIKELDLKLSFEEIKQMSQYTFKNLVKSKCKNAALKFLKKQIKRKGKEMEYTELKLQMYLSRDSELNLNEKKAAFKIRCRMTNVKCNFRNLNSNVNCAVCISQNIQSEETQEHIFLCKSLNSDNTTQRTSEMFNKIFKNEWNTEDMKASVKYFMNSMKEKEKFENKETEITKK